MYLLVRVDGKQTIPTCLSFKADSNRQACMHAKQYMHYWEGKIELLHRDKKETWKVIQSWTKPTRDKFFESKVVTDE
jgi:hypothetical protein